MAQPRVYQTEAIIIKRINLGEADRILTLYTPEHGKVKAIAKGSRRPKSKFGGHVELLTHSQLLLAHGRSLDIVTQAQTIESFLPLKENLKRMSCGLYISELVDAFSEEHTENRRLFQLLLETLHRLSQLEKSDVALRYFEIYLLNFTGYRPQLQKCANCDSGLQPVTNYFSSSQGGVLCPECIFDEPMARDISVNALKVLRLWQDCDFGTANRIHINSDLAFNLEQILREYIKYILERQVKSTLWLDRLQK